MYNARGRATNRRNLAADLKKLASKKRMLELASEAGLIRRPDAKIERIEALLGQYRRVLSCP